MTQPTVDILLPGHLDAVGESPVWSMAEQALYWVDIEAPALRRWSMADGQLTSWAAPERIACVALHANGGLIAGMETGVFHVRPGAAGLLDCTLLAMVHHPEPGMRFKATLNKPSKFPARTRKTPFFGFCGLLRRPFGPFAGP